MFTCQRIFLCALLVDKILVAFTLCSLLAVYGFYILVSSSSGCYLSNLVRLPVEIIVHIIRKAAAVENCKSSRNSHERLNQGVHSALWSGDKEIAEDHCLCNAVVVAGIDREGNTTANKL